MGFIKGYRARRVSLTGAESVQTLSAMERFFQGGKNWTQGAYHRMDGKKCLVGAAETMRTAPIEDAQFWIKQAIAERSRYSILSGIEGFNDSRRSFGEIAEVLARAKQLAASQLPAPVAERLPPSHPALTYQPQHQPQQQRGPVVFVTLADMQRVAQRRKG
jgi:hypothetical protein